MNSWIQKYKKYINPSYFPESISNESAKLDQVIDGLQNVNVVDSAENMRNVNTGDVSEETDLLNIDVTQISIEDIDQTEEELILEDPDKSFYDDVPVPKDYDNMFSVRSPLKEESCSIPSTNEAWDELWIQHGYDQYTYHYELFRDMDPPLERERSTDDDKSGIDEEEKCKFCGRQNCYFCIGNELVDYGLLGHVVLNDACAEGIILYLCILGLMLF